MDELIGIALAGLAAGIAIAMPLGAIGVLVIREGILGGWPPALGAAAGVATVDLAYSALAVTAGAAVAPAIDSWQPWPRVISAILVIGIGVRQWLSSRHQQPRASGATSRSGLAAWLRFAGLTALNPATVVYFLALAGVITAGASLAGKAVFVAGVGVASLSWQLSLAALGATASASLPDRVTDALGWVASLIIITLGVTILFW